MSMNTNDWMKTRYDAGGYVDHFPGIDENGMNGISWREVEAIRREMRDLENQRDYLRQDMRVLRNLLIVCLVALVSALVFLIATS